MLEPSVLGARRYATEFLNVVMDRMKQTAQVHMYLYDYI